MSWGQSVAWPTGRVGRAVKGVWSTYILSSTSILSIFGAAILERGRWALIFRIGLLRLALTKSLSLEAAAMVDILSLILLLIKSPICIDMKLLLSSLKAIRFFFNFCIFLGSTPVGLLLPNCMCMKLPLLLLSSVVDSILNRLVKGSRVIMPKKDISVVVGIAGGGGWVGGAFVAGAWVGMGGSFFFIRKFINMPWGSFLVKAKFSATDLMVSRVTVISGWAISFGVFWSLICNFSVFLSPNDDLPIEICMKLSPGNSKKSSVVASVGLLAISVGLPPEDLTASLKSSSWGVSSLGNVRKGVGRFRIRNSSNLIWVDSSGLPIKPVGNGSKVVFKVSRVGLIGFRDTTLGGAKFLTDSISDGGGGTSPNVINGFSSTSLIMFWRSLRPKSPSLLTSNGGGGIVE